MENVSLGIRKASSDDLLDDVFSELNVNDDDTINIKDKNQFEKKENVSLPSDPPNPQKTKAKNDERVESPIDDYYASSMTWGNEDSNELEKEQEEEEQNNSNRNMLNQAIPMDKINNGAKTAMEFWNWGFAKVIEKKNEIAENDNIKQATAAVGEAYETNLKPGFEKVKESATTGYKNVKEGANELYEKSKPKVEEFKQNPVVNEVGNKASEGWSFTAQKFGELSEACRPGIDRAVQSTRENLFGESNSSYSNNDSYEPLDSDTGGPIIGESTGTNLADV